jgi:hypothetical protein
MHGEQRLIIATCEKALVEDVNDMKDIKTGIDQIKDKYPNFVDFAAHEVFRPVNAKSVADPVPAMKFWNKSRKERVPLMEKRKKLRVGIPRVLNIYRYAPLFNGYLESLGVQPENILYSDYTSSDLYRAGATRGAIDPCFPAKIGISHVYNLIQEKHRKKALDVIFFPQVIRKRRASQEIEAQLAALEAELREQMASAVTQNGSSEFEREAQGLAAD